MKTKKKRVETKAWVKTLKKGKRHIIVLSAFVLFIAAISAHYTHTSLDQSQNRVINPAYQLRAAVVDHLSLTLPNQTFVKTAMNMLKNEGYMVDYYPGENVTVDFYRNLPSCGYKIVILRVHCGHNPERQEIAFFTSEIFRQSEHVRDQIMHGLGKVTYSNPPSEGEPVYFAVKPLFVKYSMEGRFNQTTIIMMGCYGLEYSSMAEEFVEKGAKVYIGWKGLMSADHADKATVNLLEHLVLEKQTIGRAVENTMKEVGEDPIYGSPLAFYPESGEQTI